MVEFQMSTETQLLNRVVIKYEEDLSKEPAGAENMPRQARPAAF